MFSVSRLISDIFKMTAFYLFLVVLTAKTERICVFFQDNKYQELLFKGYKEIKNKLGENGASTRAAKIIVRTFQK